MEEDDDEQMDFEYIVSNDISVSSEESDTQPLVSQTVNIIV